jgi:nickel/cobalt transporter (NiCoT) family protein
MIFFSYFIAVHDLPTDWSALCAVVFLLGMRHGFDADHLATIDGLTRLAQRRGSWLARWCGVLFSMGHGAVVMAIALVVGLVSRKWLPPGWLDGFGTAVSIVFLLGLGVINLRAVLSAAPGEVVAPVGLKGRWLGRLVQARSAWGVAGVGALFALSFDTLSQSALFAATATQFGGPSRSLTLGALFVAGMLATDGLNGWWISRLIARADQVAAVASRVMGAAVAGVSLLVAGLGVARWVSPAFEHWADGRELVFGTTVVVVMVTGYLVALRLAKQRVRRGQPA